MGDPPADTTRTSSGKRVIWDDSKSRNVYANAFNVMSSREEISLLLGTSKVGQKEGDTVSVELTDRVALSPFTAKRFAIQLNQVLQEYESKHGSLGLEPPSPLKTSPVSPPRKTKPGPGVEDKAGVLFRLLENLKMEVGFEHSFKFLKGILLCDRFLFAVKRPAESAGHDPLIMDICRHMHMPAEFQETFRSELPRANFVLFGFEKTRKPASTKPIWNSPAA